MGVLVVSVIEAEDIFNTIFEQLDRLCFFPLFLESLDAVISTGQVRCEMHQRLE